MRSMKKMIIGVICSFFFCLMLLPESKAMASTVNTELPVNQTITAATNGDTQLYHVVMAADGYFSFDFKSKNLDEDEAWEVQLLDDELNILMSFSYKKQISTVAVSATKGSSYYIKVVAQWSSSNSQLYSLTVNNVADTNWEKEGNNTQATATKIASNQTLNGMLTEDDEDWYAYTMPAKKGFVEFNVRQYDIVKTGEFWLIVKDSDGNTVYSNYGKNITSVRLAYKPGQVLYPVVSDRSDATWNHYTISANYVADDYFEVENNDTAKSATNIAVGKKYTGIVTNKNDSQDWYKFKIGKLQQVKITVAPEDFSNTNKWVVELVNSKNQNVEIFRGNTKQTYSCFLKKGTYYIKVRTEYSSTVNTAAYTVKVTASELKTSNPKVKSIKINNNSYWNGIRGDITLSATSKNAEGYVVFTDVNKKMNTKSGKKTYFSKKDKSFSFETGYYYSSHNYMYVQVAGYIDDPFGNHIYTSKKTPVKKVKLPKN